MFLSIGIQRLNLILLQESLEAWLSWWSRRRRRGCVVPDVPRICPLHNVSVEDSTRETTATDLEKHDYVCCQESHVVLVNTSRLVCIHARRVKYRKYSCKKILRCHKYNQMSSLSLRCRQV